MREEGAGQSGASSAETQDMECCKKAGGTQGPSGRVGIPGQNGLCDQLGGLAFVGQATEI